MQGKGFFYDDETYFCTPCCSSSCRWPFQAWRWAETEIPTGQVVQLTSGETYLFGTEALKVELLFRPADNEAQTVNYPRGKRKIPMPAGTWWIGVRRQKPDGRNTFIPAAIMAPATTIDGNFLLHPYSRKRWWTSAAWARCPEDLQLHADGTFSGVIRADVALYTWYRPADFIVATSYIYWRRGL